MRHTVDSSLIHKRSADQVLLLAAETSTDGSLGISVALPHGHPFTNTIPENTTLLGIELMRQCAISFAHLDGGVPKGWAFLMNELSFAWHDGMAPKTPEQFTGRVDVRLLAAKMRKDRISDLQLKADYLADGVVLGSGRGDLSTLPPQTYQAIRRNAAPATREATGPLGTVLANVRHEPEGLEAQLVWNQNDRFIFDHPSDHLSGMLLTSAVLQAHLLLTGSQAQDVSLRCENFAEYDQITRVSTSLTASGETRTTITQSGRNIAFGSCGGHRATDTTGPAVGQFHRQLKPVS
ncbi:AfsA-related hotdog domain-containing protein [Paeniglutamicibacter sp. NPDC012692]|uniref:AfsA-related hotdog domain-containing protein n=1 Tax=Paeniglutamicibacter sp. NPDC012692 TaxID=3364388 RepID=UPI0036AD3B5C